MNKKQIYLDHNSTTYVDPNVLDIMKNCLVNFYANPSSIYQSANKVKEKLSEAQDSLKKIFNIQKGKFIFTGNGSESDNLAIKGVAFANKNKGKHIITSQIEHHAVLHTCNYLEKCGVEVSYAPVNSKGIVDINYIKDKIRDDTILVSIMYANNETGVIQPIEDISQITKQKNVLFHTDAVQAAGKLDLDLSSLGVDLLSISAHKFYGPKGVGALFLNEKVKIDPLIHGGSQEYNLRAGTENVPGIIGLVEALKIAQKNSQQEYLREKKLRDTLEKGIINKIPDCIVNGDIDNRLTNTSNIIIKYVEGESILLHLDAVGIFASSGSACTSGSLEPSHVLLAMGISHDLAHGSLRFSFGKINTMEDVDYVLEVLPNIIKKLRAMSPFGK